MPLNNNWAAFLIFLLIENGYFCHSIFMNKKTAESMNVKTNAEKEWLRKLTTGKVVEKTEQKAPQRAVVQTEVMKPAPKRRNGFSSMC